MSKAGYQLNLRNLDHWIEKLEKADMTLKDAVGDVLLETAKRHTDQLQKAVNTNSSYPAGYSTGSGLTKQEVREPEVKWESDNRGYVVYGFKTDTYKTPYYLMYGTEKMSSAPKIRREIYSASVKADFDEKVKEALEEALGGLNP